MDARSSGLARSGERSREMLVGYGEGTSIRKSSSARLNWEVLSIRGSSRFRPGTGLWAILSGEARCLYPRPQAFAVKKSSAAMKK